MSEVASKSITETLPYKIKDIGLAEDEVLTYIDKAIAKLPINSIIGVNLLLIKEDFI